MADDVSETVLPLEVRRLRVEPGDTLVLRAPWKLSADYANILIRDLQARFPGVPILVLADGIDLDVLSKPKD